MVFLGVALGWGLSNAHAGLEPSGGPPQPAAAARPEPTAGDVPGGPTAPGPSTSASASATPAASAAPTAQAPKTAPAMPPSTPTAIAIPAVGIEAPIERTGLNTKGWIAAPNTNDRNLAAWYDGSPTPGADGTSVVVGHVDVKSGPAVFYKLGALHKGDTIRVRREDGTTATFAIYGIQVFRKKDFPVDRVYGGTGLPELRIITCGGSYDKKHGYDGNVVVFARLVEPKPDQKPASKPPAKAKG
ncbi:class F sortase [Yinghuangia seranimata]|uniref:class F sortase n=1 Tax=Yinghuangia seranimata TaxID=408067 RepID=UPI00248C730A|nr:class F sortase [Yinghuangia seranimata]MDI2132865.1 class F sortase [Yinghuangia seranimata]